jgi:dimethylglycine dehydrogenase
VRSKHRFRLDSYYRLSKAIEDAGSDLGYRLYGARALMSMRLEKGWGVWTLEYRPDYNAVESGMDAFINWKKDFIGKEATQTIRAAGAKQTLVTMTIDVDGIDVSGDEAILKDGKAVGYISSGGYAHRVKRSMAMGYVKHENATPGTALQVEILGEMYSAQVLGAPIYDPNGENMRG